MTVVSTLNRWDARSNTSNLVCRDSSSRRMSSTVAPARRWSRTVSAGRTKPMLVWVGEMGMSHTQLKYSWLLSTKNAVPSYRGGVSKYVHRHTLVRP